MRNIEHSYTYILEAFDKVKRARDQVQEIRSHGDEAFCQPIDVIDQLLEAQQDLLKVITGLV
jgi:hypothetical protein